MMIVVVVVEVMVEVVEVLCLNDNIGKVEHRWVDVGSASTS